jgi:hypothetical protein
MINKKTFWVQSYSKSFFIVGLIGNDLKSQQSLLAY